jgi:hypothetical protein
MKNKKDKGTAGDLLESHWVQTIKNWAVENAKDFTMYTLSEVKDTVSGFLRNITRELSQSIFTSLTIYSGLIFLMIGLALFVNDLVEISDGVGFVFVGILVVLLGVFIVGRSSK